MSADIRQGFYLGPWNVEPLRGAITGPSGDTHHLGLKVMEVLVCLAGHANETVSREQLLEEVWAGNQGADELLTGAVSHLRRVLQDGAGDQRFIETVPKRGYRLVGDVRLIEGSKPRNGPSRSFRLTPLTEHKSAVVIITAFVLGILYFGYDRFVFERVGEDGSIVNAPERGGASETAEREQSIAVLPFINMSEDPSNEYFSDGLTEEILTLLSRIPGLKVIGRTSSFAFKGKSEDLRVVGKTLGVNTVLEGSVRKSGDRIRVTAQLVSASDGAHIWSETYDRTVSDVFAVQDDVASAIVDALQIHVGTDPSRGRPTENWHAYSLFLKARASLNDYDYENAEQMLLQAVELDPTFAEAYELLAVVYFRQAGGIIRAAEGQKLTGEAACRTLAIDPDRVLAQALCRAGDLEDWSFAGEIAALENAARRQPNNPELLNALQFDLFTAGYLQEALRIAERLVELDPLSENANRRLADALYAAGHTDEAIAALEFQAQLGIDQATWNLGRTFLAAERDDMAMEYFETHERQIGATDSTWIKELVTRARNPATGQAYLDRRIPQWGASVPENVPGYTWQLGLTEWYLLFGYLDRYFEMILAHELSDSTWTDAEWLIQVGTQFRRLGFTKHPQYLDVARATGTVDVWERRGPPDYCDKVDGEWICE